MSQTLCIYSYVCKCIPELLSVLSDEALSWWHLEEAITPLLRLLLMIVITFHFLHNRRKNISELQNPELFCTQDPPLTLNSPNVKTHLESDFQFDLENVNGLREEKKLKTDILVGLPRAITMTLTAQAKTGTNKSSHVWLKGTLAGHSSAVFIFLFFNASCHPIGPPVLKS